MQDGNPFAEGGARGSAVFWAVRQAAVWIGVGAAVYLVAAAVLRLPEAMPEPAAPPAQARTAPAPSRSAPAIRNSLVYRADRSGHVFLNGYINGTPLRLLVDTGATLVTLAPRDAAAIGLDPARLDYKARLNTANGSARAAPVTLREIRIGQLTMEDVPAVVVENLGISLLGMSFLSRLDGWEMRDGALTITW